ncbi:hypothetical protein D3C71_1701130 [compost metagenome]
MGDHGLVPLDPVDLQLLPADQHCHIGSLLSCDCQLVHDLQLDVFRNAFLPELGAVDACGLAFQDLDIRSSHHFPVNIGEHPGNLGMTQYGIDPAHLVAGALGVVGCDDGFEQAAPVHGTGLVVGIHGRQEMALAGLVHPQL